MSLGSTAPSSANSAPTLKRSRRFQFWMRFPHTSAAGFPLIGGQCKISHAISESRCRESGSSGGSVTGVQSSAIADPPQSPHERRVSAPVLIEAIKRIVETATPIDRGGWIAVVSFMHRIRFSASLRALNRTIKSSLAVSRHASLRLPSPVAGVARVSDARIASKIGVVISRSHRPPEPDQNIGMLQSNL